MILEATADQVGELDSVGLVRLLRRLLHAEAQATGVALRAIDVPLQVTIADGGEDGRIEWRGGNDSTEYLPCRYTVFQSKATNPSRTDWKKEVWTKKSARSKGPKVLSDAARSVLEKNGAYVGFCSRVIVSQEKDRRVEAIRQGFCDAGAEPDRLSDILIYDANMIADWATRHPAVAVWLNEQQSGVRLRGFATLERWRQRNSTAAVPLAGDTAKRFAIGAAPKRASRDRRAAPDDDALDAAAARQRILDYLGQTRHHLRLAGLSGIGKSRFAAEIFAIGEPEDVTFDAAAAVFCDYRDFGAELALTVRSLVEARKAGLIVVDECPYDEALRLQGIVTEEGSALRLLTIGTDQRVIENNNAMTISLAPAGEDMIRQILKSLLPKVEAPSLSYIEELCGGFPRIAVLAAETYCEGEPVLHSIEDVAKRILKGCGVAEPAHMRALECLSLFSGLRADDHDAPGFNLAAERIGRLSGDEMFEHLARTERHQIVNRSNSAFSLQPAPLARYLGAKRLEALRQTTILDFLSVAPENVVLAFLDQLGDHDGSSTAKAVAGSLLSRGERFDSLDAINGGFGAACVGALTHVYPEAALYLLERHLSDASIDVLKEEFQTGRRRIVDALQRLAFRRRTFDRAARLMMRLAAAETDAERFSLSAAESFKRLYQLALSGTEATPGERFMVIDAAVEEGDPQIVAVCVEALEQTLRRSHFMRGGGPEKLGSLPPARDWHPETWADVVAFHRGGLQRLRVIRRAFPKHAARCERAIASNLRSLLAEDLFEDIREAAKEVVESRGVWYEAIESVGDWLYFDRRKGPDEFGDRVRSFYEELFPRDAIEQAILFTRFWQSDIRNPDVIYNEKDSSSRDFEYSTRKSVEVAEEIAKDKELADRAIRIMTSMDLKNVFAFARSLGEHVDDPRAAAAAAIETFGSAFGEGDGRQPIGFVCGLLQGIERRDTEVGEACLKLALDAPTLKSYHVNLYASLPLTETRLTELNERLRARTLDPRECVLFSYGRGLDGLPEERVSEFVDAVLAANTPRSYWAALEIMSMYFHGKPITAAFAEKVRKIAVVPALLDRAGNAERDAYHLETLVKKLAAADMVTDALSEGVAEHVVRLCGSDDVENFFTFDSAMRKIISIIAKASPVPLWSVLSRFFETATTWERHKLEELVGAQETSFDNELRNRAGILFAAPTDLFFNWASKDPALRAPFLCAFFPILTDDEKSWHPIFEDAVTRFGDLKTFREAIEDRLIPNSWSGSRVPLLEVFISPLEQWFHHPVEPVAAWARQKREALERMIEAERDSEH